MIPPVFVPITLKDVFLTLGNKPREKLEKKLSQYFKCQVLLTYTGRTALLVLLLAQGLKTGDEIILPAYGCAEVVRLLWDFGFKLKFVDIGKDSYNFSPEGMARKVSRNTKAILAIHAFGNPCDLAGLEIIAKKNNIIVIEDAAQAIGSEFNDKKVGSIIGPGFISFGRGKPLTTFDGGAILVREETIFQKCREIVKHFREQTLKMELLRSVKILGYSLMRSSLISDVVYRYLREGQLNTRVTALDWRFRFSPRQTQLGISQLVKLPEFIQKRRENVQFLKNNLRDVFLPTALPRANPSFLRYPIRFGSRQLRDGAKTELEKAGIKASITYPDFLPLKFGDQGAYPNTRKVIDTALMLPCHPLVKKRDLEMMVKIINEIALSENA